MATGSWIARGTVLLLTLTGCVDCEYRIIQEARSPDGARNAVAYASMCGGMGTNASHVSILRPGARARGRSNVFVGSLSDPEVVRGPHGGPEVAVRWRGNDTLEVDYDTAAVVWRQARFRDVTVVYGRIPTRKKNP